MKHTRKRIAGLSENTPFYFAGAFVFILILLATYSNQAEDREDQANNKALIESCQKPELITVYTGARRSRLPRYVYRCADKRIIDVSQKLH